MGGGVVWGPVQTPSDGIGLAFVCEGVLTVT